MSPQIEVLFEVKQMTLEKIKCKFCDFQMQTPDDEELMKMIKTHNQKHHPDVDVSDDMIRQRIEKI
jgi:predicted small metal-binding protein